MTKDKQSTPRNNSSANSQSSTTNKHHAQALELDSIHTMLRTLHRDWVLQNDSTIISREFRFKGFAKAVYLSNLCAWLADAEGHHPDIAFGWGYCRVSLTTHALGSLSQSDFDWAAKLDKLVA